MDTRSPLPLLESERRQLVRAAARLLGQAEAEDAVQDAYVRALEADTLALHSAQAWLRTVVQRLAIDSLRRRQWMQQWLASVQVGELQPTARTAAPSAETTAALAEEVGRALHLLATLLSPSDGAALLLFEVFDVSHAEIARVTGRSEASRRQQLRRALLRLRQARSAAEPQAAADREPADEGVLQRYLQALQLRDPQTLWAMLREPPISASANAVGLAAPVAASAQASGPAPATACSVLQWGGQLGLVLSLDGVRLCVVPLGVRTEHAPGMRHLLAQG